ncbi:MULTISPECIES: primosomal replication protein [Shewanella]|uniref:Prepilin peptidase n=1 Tax=Shewanella marisflavi TaxID=260364 RepID=A0AAC9U0M7_9GAMM|nr:MULTISPECIES: primosomal replication protein [Shewanella]ASJ96331.1 prepilin peptidase [Shewanella marisflavi]MCL1042183.1 primosomal replication protein [Shewanella marisflavi]QDF74858.1 prepilin peptidase [Shewanella marisflavi]
MKTNELIHRLRVQLKQLEQEVLQHDSQLPKGERKLLQDTERFNDKLFNQAGAQLGPCIDQLSKKIAQLEKLLQGNISADTIALSCEGIQDRFTALKRALNTTGLGVKSAQQQKTSRIAHARKRRQNSHAQSGFSWIAAGVMNNSHQLYEELNKHMNWVHTFEQKIAHLQSKLENCHSADKIALQNEILLVHRRLGKCRQAISYIEDRIQAFERPYKHQNR